MLDAFGSGAATLDELAAGTGLPRDLVDAAVDHLVRTGRVTSTAISAGCPPAGCGGCVLSRSGRPGCGAPGPSSARSRPGLVALSLARG